MIIDSFSGDYRWLSNFWYSPVRQGSIVWPTVEHGYQFEKAILDEETVQTEEFVLFLDQFFKWTPGQVKAWGRTIELRPDWEDIKDTTMTRLVKAKFRNLEMREKLLATGDAELIEGNTWNDTYWGVCNGVGKNMLGKILMAERHELRMFA